MVHNHILSYTLSLIVITLGIQCKLESFTSSKTKKLSDI